MNSVAEVLDDYVGDVVRHLPRTSRADVGFELRALLDESLAERVASGGRPADDAMVLALLREIGEPAEVALRYAEPAPVLIPATATRSFLTIAVLGVVVQWLATLPDALQSASALGQWWVSRGIGALWWPGAMVLGQAARLWWTMRPRSSQTEWNARAVDRARVDAPVERSALALTVTGAVIVCLLPLLRMVLPSPSAEAFAVSSQFVREHGWQVIALFAGTIGVRLRALMLARWSKRLRELDVVVQLAWVGAMGRWLTVPIFVAPTTDVMSKVVVVLALASVVASLLRAALRRRPTIAVPRTTH